MSILALPVSEDRWTALPPQPSGATVGGDGTKRALCVDCLLPGL